MAITVSSTWSVPASQPGRHSPGSCTTDNRVPRQAPWGRVTLPKVQLTQTGGAERPLQIPCER